MSKPYNSRDAHLAWEIHNQINRLDVTGITENAAFPNNVKENYKPETLIDKTLEIIDPTPNIHTLFVQFDKKFFQNKLLSVEVKWSPRMTSCAGTCSFNTGNRYCVIALSSPLLKLRPRKDLVETLLHEMIHAFLFVTNNNRDRDGHGPEFCKHMHRINKEAGTNITIYHTFHAEVRLYQQHWWRCNGPCQKRHPFFGMVRRSMNRAPGPNDFWWKEHQSTCGGQFIKVREPEKPEKKGKKAKDNSQNPSLDKWLTPSQDNKPKGKSGSGNSQKPPDKFGSNNFRKPNDKIGTGKKTGASNSVKTGGVGVKTKGGSSVITVNKWNANRNSTEPGIAKLGNETNNVHGFGTGGPGSSTSSSSSSKGTTSSAKPVSFSGTLGGSGSGQSRLLKLSGSSNTGQPNAQQTSKNDEKSKNESFGPTVKCPICQDLILETIANEHIDSCLIQKNEKEIPSLNSKPKFTPDNKGVIKNEKTPICPVCNKAFPASRIEDHVLACLENDKFPDSPSSEKIFTPDSFPSSNSPSVPSQMLPIVINDTDSDLDVTPTKKRKISDFFNTKEPKLPKNSVEKASCPVCKKEIDIDEMNRHLDECLIETSDPDMNEAGPSSRVANKNDSEINYIQNGKPEDNENETPERCLICQEILKPGISLIQHLDDCLKGMFDDKPIDKDNKEEATKKKNIENNENGTKPRKSLLNGNEENKTKPEKRLTNGKTENETEPKKCSICGKMIDPEIFKRHFDDCLKDVLDDAGNASESSSMQEIKIDEESQIPSFIKTEELIEIDDSSSGDENDDSNGKEKSNRFPCPVCLTLVPQSEMNKHLDSCLG